MISISVHVLCRKREREKKAIKIVACMLSVFMAINLRKIAISPKFTDTQNEGNRNDMLKKKNLI